MTQDLHTEYPVGTCAAVPTRKARGDFPAILEANVEITIYEVTHG
jgi:hypothetical protein